MIVEFDGMVKYEGLNGKQALADEKERERRLAQLGFEVVRVVWHALDSRGAIVAAVRAARTLARERRRAMSRVGG